MKKLSDIIECPYSTEIFGIADDSRLIKPGYLFVATKGFCVDHFDYISDAIKNGAVALLLDREPELEVSVPYIVIDTNINDAYITCCQKYYDVNPLDFSLIGITGTDGKTTTATIVHELLNSIVKTAYLGTNGLKIDQDVYTTNNTTPCISELYDSFAKAKENKCKVVSMEVSSEALLHHRLKNLEFDIVGYTNITEDHLNVHGTISNYVQCKLRLLNFLKPDGIAIVNGDDKNCRSIESKCVYYYGFNSDNDYVISNVKNMSSFVNFQICCKDKIYDITSPYLGMYNVYNVTLAFLVCLFYGIDAATLISHIRMLSPVSGRRELLYFGQNYDIILDYAHTVNGIRNILDSVCDYKHIITVTGAAGGREKEKRPIIGKLVLEKSDVVIFTMDDPRFEDVDDIIDQMVGDSKVPYFRIIDRQKAIWKALSLATPSSVVLILGKGRDTYMAVGNEKQAYCDYDVLRDYFSAF